jgi:hypothetical protein
MGAFKKNLLPILLGVIWFTTVTLIAIVFG